MKIEDLEGKLQSLGHDLIKMNHQMSEIHNEEMNFEDVDQELLNNLCNFILKIKMESMDFSMQCRDLVHKITPYEDFWKSKDMGNKK